ncbi:angiopoietin-4-like [Anopheles aquasalis]|uniref:angiopoietin-4-like n=1 Tax=Anopheles aquasalis TaxID=42839 RepID=UPI00215ADBAF|nr:angiopoietin-4-like [Anopheles aquasalis]
MKLTICFLLVCAAALGWATDQSPESEGDILKPSTVGGISEIGLEILLTRLNTIDHKLMILEELKSELQQHREQMESSKASLEKTTTAATTTTTTTTPESTTITRQSKITTTAKLPTTALITTFKSCKDAPANVSGVYSITINNERAPFNVYCEMEEFEGGWIVVQHRFNGSVDFYRNWTEYRDGFGELNGEFWLGLEQIHQLTAARKHELVIEMKDFEGNYGYARYFEFEIGSERKKYDLTVDSYWGTAGDAMTLYNNREKFSTKDRDSDGNRIRHFAVEYEGAWWYGYGGGLSNLNGRYQNVTDRNSMTWHFFKDDFRGMSFTRMMIREL